MANQQRVFVQNYYILGFVKGMCFAPGRGVWLIGATHHQILAVRYLTGIYANKCLSFC
jgi:hypothetical protein